MWCDSAASANELIAKESTLTTVATKAGRVRRPLFPALETELYVIWKKQQVFTPIAERFIEELQQALARS